MAQSTQLGFFTDTSLCIGCKACEVACKEWNQVPASNEGFTGMSYDNTVDLGRGHLAPRGVRRAVRRPEGMRWLMSSDVCKHCAHAACLEVCPTGALFRTEFDTVVVQPDICNGCGYCVPACPFGVIDRREDDGRAFKCTLCYDRLKDDMTPACAQACPTHSIQFGELGDLREPRRRASRSSTRRARTARGCTSTTSPTASAARTRSSCCSTSPRSTGCRRTRSTRRATSGRSGRRPAAAALALGAGIAAASLGGQVVTDSYYGRPVIKAPVWTPEIPAYFFAGGMAGASAGLAYMAELTATRSWRGARGRSRWPGSRSARRC